MKRLHDLLAELTNISADIENLRTVLRVVEWSADTGEDELRAVVNVAMLCLTALKEQSEMLCSFYKSMCFRNFQEYTGVFCR